MSSTVSAVNCHDGKSFFLPVGFTEDAPYSRDNIPTTEICVADNGQHMCLGIEIALELHVRVLQLEPARLISNVSELAEKP
jgi:hypothetical protein